MSTFIYQTLRSLGKPAEGYPFNSSPHFVEGTKQIKVDSNGLRIFDHIKDSTHLVLAGGSNMLGWGLKPEQTIANQLFNLEEFKRTKIISYAYPGWGPNNLLAKFHQLDNIDFEKLEQGSFIYLFHDIHFERVCGSPYYFKWSSGMAPYFSLKENKLLNEGLYSTSWIFHKEIMRIFIDRINEILKIIPIARLSTDMNVNFSEWCQELFIAHIVSLKSSYYKKFPKGRFIILGYFELENIEFLRKLKKKDIEYFSIQKMTTIQRKDPKYFFSDGHFNELSALEISQLINKILM